MNSARWTEIANPDHGFVEDRTRPVIPFCLDVEDAGCAAPHAHPRAQLIFASRGVMRIVTPNDTWFVPPTQAVLVPPHVEHQVFFPGKVAIRNLFIDADFAAALPTSCQVFNVTPLLRELILRFTDRPPEYASESPATRLAAVLLDELRDIAPAPLNLPTSREPRLARVMDALLRTPGDPRGLDDWARNANAAPRTLARLFRRETGMSFAAWRTQLRMLEALDRLSDGQSVTDVALDLGYGDASAFIAAFRRQFGAPPGRYLRTKANGA